MTESADAPAYSGGRELRATVRTTGEERFFDGHFPNGAILPGAALLALAAQLLAEAGMAIGTAPRVRFIEPVEPGTAVEILAVVRDGRADVTWSAHERLIARARFTLTEA